MNTEQPVTPADSGAEQPQSATIVITMPAKVKRAIVAAWRFVCEWVSGEVIVSRSVSKGYDYLFGMAVAFMLSIVALFYSLYMQIEQNALQSKVKLLEEKAVRTREQLLRETTHSAILNKLEQRGLEMYDPQQQLTIIKE